MDNQQKKRKYLWVYAGVLFLSAFAVLLLTAFSQMRLTSNIEEYKQKLKDHEDSIKGINLSLNTATEEKNTLKKRIQELEEENNALKSVTAGAGNPSLLSQEITKSKKSFDNLLIADNLFNQDQKISCAKVLRNVRQSDLGGQALQKYAELKKVSYKDAAKYFYNRGLDRIFQDNYDKAKTCFEEVLSFDESKKYEENTLYYLAKINVKLKNSVDAQKYSKMLASKYPDSEYNAKLKSMQ